MSISTFDEVNIWASDISRVSSAVKNVEKVTSQTQCLQPVATLSAKPMRNVSGEKQLLARASSDIEMHIENNAPPELTHFKVFFYLIYASSKT